ncbi:hypothetical protein T492DRAFT_1037743, partial [Pavlovales sp. CCMP2436]
MASSFSLNSTAFFFLPLFVTNTHTHTFIVHTIFLLNPEGGVDEYKLIDIKSARADDNFIYPELPTQNTGPRHVHNHARTRSKKVSAL